MTEPPFFPHFYRLEKFYIIALDIVGALCYHRCTKRAGVRRSGGTRIH